jgi:hypothetical protein
VALRKLDGNLVGRNQDGVDPLHTHNPPAAASA